MQYHSKLASRASVIYHAPKYQPQVGFILSLRDRERSRSKHQNLFFFFIVVSVPASPPFASSPRNPDLRVRSKQKQILPPETNRSSIIQLGTPAPVPLPGLSSSLPPK